MSYKEIQEKWQRKWEEKPEMYRAYDSDAEYEKAKGMEPKGKKYILTEFPYPSGTGLHVGHVFSYTATDVYARFCRMDGFNVLCPMGWDAFGLPTENYAIKTKRKPQEITSETTDYCRMQMKTMALSFDWSRELFTTDPQYYAWTQWIFIKLWEKGLAYKAKMPINWCPSCKIGLANEEVVDGKCERCGTQAGKRDIEQWVVKITEYADRLVDGLAKTEFIEKVKASQINWIGKKEGAVVNFKTSNFKFLNQDKIQVFTTRPDTIFGVSAVVVSPEHDLITQNVGTPHGAFLREEVKKYLDSVKNKSDLERTDLNKDKTGVFTGLYAVNPVNGKEVPVWVADYVLNSFGTGAIMLVPGHDKRDFEFAKKYRLEIVKVVDPPTPYIGGADKGSGGMCFEGDGIAINSEFLDGLSSSDARLRMYEWLAQTGSGKKEVTYHIRDWIFSRQHYWGEPVPMVSPSLKATAHQEKLWQPVLESELPVVLPEVEKYEPTETGESPLANIGSFVNYKEGWVRETDTMPNWAGSDWYFVGYLMPEVYRNLKFPPSSETSKKENLKDSENVFLKNQERLKYWLPVDVYIGGDEHTTLHLLYSRFVYQFLYDLGMVPTPEPYFKRLSHGIILAPDGRKMSKSKGNVIDPIPVAEEHGIDTIRSYMMFMGPFEATMPWNEKTMMGVKRFLARFEKFALEKVEKNSSISDKRVVSMLHKTIRDMRIDLEQMKFNTPLAKMMSFLNECEGMDISRQDLGKLVRLLAPYAPYLTEELWEKLDLSKKSVHEELYPEYDASLISQDTVTVPVCINGKVKEQLILAKEEVERQEVIEKKALESRKIKEILGLKKVQKVIYVPGKMLNLVV